MATCFATPAVLVTADDRDRRKLLVKTMEAAGHTVFTALDRAIALTRLYTHPAPLIVILVWMMPDLDGLEVLQAMATKAP